MSNISRTIINENTLKTKIKRKLLWKHMVDENIRQKFGSKI